jgi:hypothetical protein
VIGPVWARVTWVGPVVTVRHFDLLGFKDLQGFDDF